VGTRLYERYLYQGPRFRTLNILDEGVREALAIEIDTSLPAERAVRTLQQLAACLKRFDWITARADRATMYHLVRGDGH
jgi:hypothetical protein